MSMAERFADMVLSWEGAPYVHRGTRVSGCDCTGLIIGSLQAMGFMPNYKLRCYPRDWNLHAGAGDYIQQELGVIADQVEDMPHRGDIVLFRFGKCIAHAGVIIKPGVFCHCAAGERKVKRALLRTPQWKNRLVAVWRINDAKVEALP